MRGHPCHVTLVSDDDDDDVFFFWWRSTPSNSFNKGSCRFSIRLVVYSGTAVVGVQLLEEYNPISKVLTSFLVLLLLFMVPWTKMHFPLSSKVILDKDHSVSNQTFLKILKNRRRLGN